MGITNLTIITLQRNHDFKEIQLINFASDRKKIVFTCRMSWRRLWRAMNWCWARRFPSMNGNSPWRKKRRVHSFDQLTNPRCFGNQTIEPWIIHTHYGTKEDRRKISDWMSNQNSWIDLLMSYLPWLSVVQRIQLLWVLLRKIREGKKKVCPYKQQHSTI